MRILVTGASGFIGSHVARRLADAGHAVIATGRDVSRLAPLAGVARTTAADLARDPLGLLVSGCDVVVHCAALSAPWGRPAEFHRANVVATERLLDAAAGAGVRRLVHLGSPSIYFRFRDQYDLDEDFEPPARWITAYARSKWESECRVRAATGLETLVLRPRAVFGQGDRAILPRLLAVAERGWFPVPHAGRALVDVTHVDNLADLVVRCLDAGVPAQGRAYNVTNGEPVRVSELLDLLFRALGREVRQVPIPRAPMLALASAAECLARWRRDRPEPRLSRYGIGVLGYSQTLDIGRARRELGYRPSLGLADGIAKLARSGGTHGSA